MAKVIESKRVLFSTERLDGANRRGKGERVIIWTHRADHQSDFDWIDGTDHMVLLAVLNSLENSMPSKLSRGTPVLESLFFCRREYGDIVSPYSLLQNNTFLTHCFLLHALAVTHNCNAIFIAHSDLNADLRSGHDDHYRQR